MKKKTKKIVSLTFVFIAIIAAILFDLRSRVTNWDEVWALFGF